MCTKEEIYQRICTREKYTDKKFKQIREVNGSHLIYEQEVRMGHLNLTVSKIKLNLSKITNITHK